MGGRNWARWRRSAPGVVTKGGTGFGDQQLASIFAQQFELQFELLSGLAKFGDRRGGVLSGIAADPLGTPPKFVHRCRHHFGREISPGVLFCC